MVSNIDEEKISVLDDTILYVWKNASKLTLENINKMIQELINVLDK